MPVPAITSPSARNVLTPEALAMLQAAARFGSFAAAAREMGLVPSALTYRVRQIEEALDVLLFDRSSRQARLTEAGAELLRQGEQLLRQIDAIANRVKRVATGWEPQLTIAVDTVIERSTLLELVEAFQALNPPTRLRLRDEALSGTLEALISGRADLAIGVVPETASVAGIRSKPLGALGFVYAVAPHHPLARAAEPISDETLLQHRAVAVADSNPSGNSITLGLLGGQDVLTVSSMQAKLEAQLLGLGAGFLPEPWARAALAQGLLVTRRVERSNRDTRSSYAWRATQQPGRALQWWLHQLEKPLTRMALLDRAAIKATPSRAGRVESGTRAARRPANRKPTEKKR
ncbi:MAG: LysR family transcriptional regulator [Betaproteobacteria bacterium]|nr:LysR family transcriptional regulator [Betaproteobacteria bacterium]